MQHDRRDSSLNDGVTRATDAELAVVYDPRRADLDGGDAFDIDDSTFDYHLNELVDVGLVEKHQRTQRGQDGLYTYYRATVFGEVTVTDGVDELIRGEHALEEMYDSSTA